MNIVISSPHHLPSMIDRAAQALLNAKSSAEVLEARDMAGHVYDVAKRTARLAKAKDAHDSLIAAAHRAQADALDIEAQAKRRLADEYDAAQERGEVAKLGTNQSDLGVSEQNTRPATTSDLGISRKDIHEARRTLRLAPNTVKTILAREKISVVTGRPGRKVGASGCHRKGVAVPGWVPSGLIPDYIAAARMYGEEKAAFIVRRLKAEATR